MLAGTAKRGRRSSARHVACCSLRRRKITSRRDCMAESTKQRQQNRQLTTLQELLAIEATEVGTALDRARDLISVTLRADKVDVFLFDPTINSLVAAGTSHTPMGQLQRQLGLERLPLAGGGRNAEVY